MKSRLPLLVLVVLAGIGEISWATQTSLSMSSDPGDYIGGGQQYYYSSSDGAFTAYRNFANGVSVSFNTPTFDHWWYLDFAAAFSQPLTVGVYTGAVRYPFQDPSQPGLSVYGDGRGCNMLTGSFEVREIVYGAGDEIASFRAFFEQHCEGQPPALRGEIRFGANVPVELTAPRSQSVVTGNELAFDVTAIALNGGPVTLTAADLPFGASFTDDGDNTGTFAWTPVQGQVGVYTVTFTGQDSQGATESASTTISVGGTIHVPADEPTIQSAIDAATTGSRVVVAPGVYVENINFLGKGITVVSESGPGTTIIDGGGAGSVVTFASGEGRDALLEGFTIRNGFAGFSPPNFGDGGGVYVGFSSPTIRGNIITNNRACAGGGITAAFASPRIERNDINLNSQAGCSGGVGGGGISIRGAAQAEIIGNVIANNTTFADGGGLSLFAAGTPTIRDNEIKGNSASQGGGIWMVNFSDAEIVGNVITANHASQGGGIWWLVVSGARGPRVLNNTIVDNDSELGSGIYADGYDAQTEVVNNIVYAHEAQTALYCGDFNDRNPPVLGFNDVFSPSGSAYGGLCAGLDPPGSISADPEFLCTFAGDFRPTAGSPVIEAGDGSVPGLPETDIAGKPRVVDGNNDGAAVIDMGAYEFDPEDPGECFYIVCPGAVEATASPGQTGAVVEYPPPSASPGASVSCQPPSGSSFPVGTTNVECTATAPGQSATCSFPVIVTVRPRNDDFDFATAVPAVPFTEGLDTRQATTAVDDPFCGGRNATVWYALTPAEDTLVDASSFGSSYLATLSAYIGTRGALAQLACGYESIRFMARAGETVHVMVDSFDAGGDLVFTMTGRPALKVKVLLDGIGSVTPGAGVGVVSGTVTCSRGASVFLAGALSQRNGRTITTGSFEFGLSCEGDTSWESPVASPNGPFVAGKAEAEVTAYAYDPDTGETSVSQNARAITLKRRTLPYGGVGSGTPGKPSINPTNGP